MAFEIDVYEKATNGVTDFRGLLIKGSARLIEDVRERRQAAAFLRARHPEAPFGENPIVVEILPMRRFRWGAREKVYERE